MGRSSTEWAPSSRTLFVYYLRLHATTSTVPPAPFRSPRPPRRSRLLLLEGFALGFALAVGDSPYTTTAPYVFRSRLPRGQEGAGRRRRGAEEAGRHATVARGRRRGVDEPATASNPNPSRRATRPRLVAASVVVPTPAFGARSLSDFSRRDSIATPTALDRMTFRPIDRPSDVARVVALPPRRAPSRRRRTHRSSSVHCSSLARFCRSIPVGRASPPPGQRHRQRAVESPGAPAAQKRDLIVRPGEVEQREPVPPDATHTGAGRLAGARTLSSERRFGFG